jgi:hypothetical protein
VHSSIRFQPLRPLAHSLFANPLRIEESLIFGPLPRAHGPRTVQAVARPVFCERSAAIPSKTIDYDSSALKQLTKNRNSTIIRRSILSRYAAKTFGLNKFLISTVWHESSLLILRAFRRRKK